MGLRVRWSRQSRGHLLTIRQPIREDNPVAAERMRVRIAPKTHRTSASVHRHHLNLETRSACSRMTRALSSTSVPVGSPLYMTRGFGQ